LALRQDLPARNFVIIRHSSLGIRHSFAPAFQLAMRGA
jgi:hypothetical protein